MQRLVWRGGASGSPHPSSPPASSGPPSALLQDAGIFSQAQAVYDAAQLPLPDPPHGMEWRLPAVWPG
eukprot:8325160-Prorocentrum_lima.AAC.1